MKALILENLQKDFFEGGRKVKDADLILDSINKIISKFDLIIFTKDYVEQVNINYNDLVDNIFSKITENNSLYIFNKQVDDNKSFSAFYSENQISTGLSEFLDEKEVDQIFVAGINYNNSVNNTIDDAIYEGFKVVSIIDAIKFTDQNIASFIEKLTNNDVKIIESWELPLFNLL